MQKTQSNFVDTQELGLVATVHPDVKIGPIVSLTYSEGPLRFQFDMRPEQARELAHKLEQLAGALDVQVAARKQAEGVAA